MTHVSILNKTLSSLSEQLDVCVHQNSVDESLGIILGILIPVIVFFFIILIIIIIVLSICLKKKSNKIDNGT